MPLASFLFVFTYSTRALLWLHFLPFFKKIHLFASNTHSRHRYLNTEEIHKRNKLINILIVIMRLLDRILRRINVFFCLLESVQNWIF